MYKAITTKIKTKPHSNADRVQLGNCLGYQVVIGLDVKDGDLGIFFPPDGQLSERFCEENDLIGYTDEKGNKKGGYFSKRRRVKCQNFRGEKSEGFWIPVSSVDFTGAVLKEGYKFNSLNDIPICNKYYTPKTQQRITKNKKKKTKRKENKFFLRHFDTKQFRIFSRDIPFGSLITITEKLHGTSHRIGRLPERRGIRKLKFLKPKHYIFNGTRRVEMSKDYKDYTGVNFRLEVVESFSDSLHKGETIYMELVGWVNENSTIMPRHSTSELKEIRKRYGSEITYSYGCRKGQCMPYVYRITHTNEDGVVIELPHWKVVERCKELGINAVPLLHQFIYDGNEDNLKKIVEELTVGPSFLDDRHIREGVCVRYDHRNSKILKNKSYEFGIMEGYIKSNDNYIDLEEQS